jgi:hypothetical protein
VNIEGGKGEGGEGEGPYTTVVFTALPGLLLAVVSVVALAMAAFGRYPMWPHKELTLAEAAGSRDEAEVVRLIESGQDPNGRYPVREGLLFERAAALTPLEAAVLNDDPAIVRQLLSRGASADGASWAVLRCVAGSRVAPVLDEYRPSQGPDCAGIKTPWD